MVVLIALLIYSVVVIVVLTSFLDRTPDSVAASIRENAIEPAGPPGEPVEFTIEEGSGADDVVRQLVAAGILRDGDSLRVLLSLTGTASGIQAGRYALAANLPTGEVWYRLQQGPNLREVITFREGLRVEEIGAILVAEEIATAAEWQAALRAERAERHLAFLDLRPEGADLTGYLLPATFEIDDDTTALSLLEAMLDAFEEQVTPELIAEAEELGWTLHEILTLAAIVEREAVHPEEQGTVASVFHNRLEIGMPLQADPTVQYAVSVDPIGGEDSVAEYGYWKRELTITDLALDSPYNTYEYLGLPPGPIANAGIGAIIATIRPQVTEYYYFVAHPDCDGRHLFAETLDQHNINVEAFRESGCGQEDF